MRSSPLRWFRMKFTVLKHLIEFRFENASCVSSFIYTSNCQNCVLLFSLNLCRFFLFSPRNRHKIMGTHYFILIPFKLLYFFSRDCDLTLLKPLWQLFTHMENNLCHDMAKPGILLPLHRALAELFFVTENRVTVSSSCTWIPPLPTAGNDNVVQC